MQATVNNIFSELSILESIVSLTKEACLKQEVEAIYYNLPPKDKFSLSQERTNYINMLSIALDKIDSLIMINNELERNLKL